MWLIQHERNKLGGEDLEEIGGESEMKNLPIGWSTSLPFLIFNYRFIESIEMDIEKMLTYYVPGLLLSMLGCRPQF